MSDGTVKTRLPRTNPLPELGLYPSAAEMEAYLRHARLLRSRETARILTALFAARRRITSTEITPFACVTGLFVFLVAIAFVGR